MAGRIPETFINDLLGRVDIVDVIGSRIQLKKSGRNHKGLCPFHDEKTPSFNVNEDRQSFHCFGCEAHGTAIGFLMDYDSLTFPEAIETLASMVGMEVPREASRGPKPDTELYDVLQAAARQFQRWLRGGDATGAVSYLKERGLSGEVARDFGIGLAPAGWDGIKTALASFGEQKLIDAGLLIRQEGGRGRVYDRFRERIVFPIRNTRGRVIGFGGRVYGDGQPKYINSPETEVFRKGRELYGLYEARRAQRGLQSVVVVEGYMDVVALAQHGVNNAVATLGTAIGQAHFETLYRHVNLVVCCFDGDDAGRGAAWKAVDAAFPVLSETRQLKFVFLPESEDPDTVVRNRGADHFRALLDNAKPVGEYFLDHLQEGVDVDQADGRALLAELAAPHIRRLPRGALRDVLVTDLAARVRMQASAVAQAADTAWGSSEDWRPVENRTNQGQGIGNKPLLKYVVQYPQLIEGMDAKVRADLADAADVSLLADVVRHLVEDPGMNTGTLVGCFVGRAGYDELAALTDEEILLPEEAIVEDLETRARRYVYERQGAVLKEAAIESGTLEDAKRRSDAKVQQML